MGDFIALIFIISLGRFFLSLAGLDTASAFAGMGSSREMFISGLAEPIALLSIFAISFNCGSTSLQLISASAFFKFSTFLAAVSLFIVIIAETSRLPIDNQETHLELTMVHEAMALEYSGRSLALLEMAAYIKQVVFFSLIIAFLFPSGSVLTYFIRLIFICIGVAVLEVSLAKMRLFRVVDLLTFSIVISLLAVVTQALGF